MQAVLVLFKADGEKRSFALTKEVTVLGRREDCDLRIPLLDISRKHCRFIREADSLRLEDMGSSNGTFVNDQRIQEAILQPGDTVRVGPVTFVIQIDGMPADDQIQPPLSPEDTAVTAAQGQADSAAGEFDPMSALEADEQEEEESEQDSK